jgi:hypothetical protein
MFMISVSEYVHSGQAEVFLTSMGIEPVIFGLIANALPITLRGQGVSNWCYARSRF